MWLLAAIEGGRKIHIKNIPNKRFQSFSSKTMLSLLNWNNWSFGENEHMQYAGINGNFLQFIKEIHFTFFNRLKILTKWYCENCKQPLNFKLSNNSANPITSTKSLGSILLQLDMSRCTMFRNCNRLSAVIFPKYFVQLISINLSSPRKYENPHTLEGWSCWK